MGGALNRYRIGNGSPRGVSPHKKGAVEAVGGQSPTRGGGDSREQRLIERAAKGVRVQFLWKRGLDPAGPTVFARGGAERGVGQGGCSAGGNGDHLRKA